MRTVLAMVALGGFAATVVEVSLITVQALWRLNHLAAEVAWVITNAPWERIIWKKRRLEDEDADDED